MSTPPIPSEVLYGLLTQQNSSFTAPYADCTFGTPSYASVEQFAQYGRNSQVTVQVTGYEGEVALYYDRIPIQALHQQSLLGANLGLVHGLPFDIAPSASYGTVDDLLSWMNTKYQLGLTPSDVLPQSMLPVPAVTTNAAPALGLVEVFAAPDSLGWAGAIAVAYQGTSPQVLSEVFPVVQLTNTAQTNTGAADPVLSYLQTNQAIGSLEARPEISVSNLTALDEATSQANGGLNTSVLLTASGPNYTGSVTVYYNRTATAPSIGGYPGNAYCASPTAQVMAHDILTTDPGQPSAVQPYYITLLPLFQSDVVNVALPVLTGTTPVTATFTIADTSVGFLPGTTFTVPLIDGTANSIGNPFVNLDVDLPDPDPAAAAANGQLPPDVHTQIAAVLIAPGIDIYADSNLVLSLSAVQVNDSATQAAHGGRQYSLGASVAYFSQTASVMVYFNRISVQAYLTAINGSAAVGGGQYAFASDGSIVLYTDPITFDIPFLVYEWLASQTLLFFPLQLAGSPKPIPSTLWKDSAGKSIFNALEIFPLFESGPRPVFNFGIGTLPIYELALKSEADGFIHITLPLGTTTATVLEGAYSLTIQPLSGDYTVAYNLIVPGQTTNYV